MRYSLIILLLLTIVVAGCSTQNSVDDSNEITCDKPYILNGRDCCLDKDANTICDRDEVSESDSEQDSEDELNVLVSKYGRLYESDKYSEMYDLLTDDRKSQISKDDFINLYSSVYYGVTEIYSGNELASRQVHPNPVYSMIVDNVEIVGNTAYVTYIMTPTSKYQEVYKSQVFIFKKESGEWKFDGNSYLVYAGCYETDECVGPELNKMCKQSCIDQKGMPLREENSYSCKENICYCKCWDKETQAGYNVVPDTKYIKEI